MCRPCGFHRGTRRGTVRTRSGRQSNCLPQEINHMHKIASLALVGLLLAAPLPVFAQSMQPRMPIEKISGVIATVSGDEVDVTAADGSKDAVMLGDKSRIALTMPIAVDEIKPGSFIG